MEFLWFLSGIRNDFLDMFFQTVTRFGEEIILMVFICILFWCINKRLGYEMGFAFCLSGLFVQGLKIIFRIDRPWILDADFKPVGSAIEEATGYSFPSGHTQSATSVFGSFAVNVKKNWLRILAIVIFVLVGFSRMYLGVHTPKDVLVGMALSLCVVVFVHWLFKYPSKIKWLLVFMAIICVALFILADSLFVMEIVEERYVKNCCQAIGAAMGFLVGYLFENKYVRFEEKQTLGIQIGKVVVGLICVVLLKFGLKAIFPHNLFGYTFQNFILILVISFVYPMIFTMVINKLQKKA